MSATIELYEISNANFRRYLYLARSKDEAVEMALLRGDLRNRKNAWRVLEGVDVVAKNDSKFGSAVRRAIAKGATGPVTNSDGIALVYSEVFLPLSSV